LPWDVQVSGTFQALPGPEITAAYVATNADIVPGSLNRRLSAGTATVPLVEPGTLFAERLTQVDLRGSKDFRVGGVRVRGMVDAYNVFNANPVLGLNNQYSAQAWQRPTFVLPGRLVKFGVQIDY
jgi:outer membrane receptor protein involved in Fe transport